MEKWLPAAIDYIPRWLEFQMRQSEQPGCVIAIGDTKESGGRIVLEQAFGHADLDCGTPLTPRHRFRVASHSKTFTSAGIMKLREQGRLKLEGRCGQYVEALHPAIGDATIGQLLSHSAGLTREGPDADQWQDRRPFLDQRGLREVLAQAPAIAPNSRLKYSNPGFGLLGLVIEAVTGEPYNEWIKREIVTASGLRETEPDAPLATGVPVASGHSAKLPAGRRFVIPGDNPTHALAPATGFVSTAADLARFFGQLDPAAPRSILSAASRREMIRPRWPYADSSVERHYALGVICGTVAGCEWFGHSGSFQGFISQTLVVPQYGLAVSIVTNTVERFANTCADGILQIVAAFARHGPPDESVRDWGGRWCSLFNVVDLVPMGERVLVLTPAFANPLSDASEVEVTGADTGWIALAPSLGSYGEPVRRSRGAGGHVEEVWLGGTRLLPEDRIVRELESRYGKTSGTKAEERRQ